MSCSEAPMPAGLVSFATTDLADLAAGHAQGTSRLALLQADGPAQVAGARVELVIAWQEQVDAGLLSRVVDLARRQAYLPGVICGRSERELGHRLARALAGLAEPLADVDATQRSDLLPELPLGVVQAARRRVLGNDASPNIVDATLAAGQQILYVSTHGDGIDAHLPGGRILCSLKGHPAAPAATARAPACLHSNQCHRLSLPLAQALRDERLLACGSLRARLLFFDACYMVPTLAAGAGIAADHGLWARLLENDALGGILMGLDLRARRFGDAFPAVDAIQDGDAVGAALGRFLASSHAVDLDVGIVLFGDPEQRVAAPRSPPTPPPAPPRRTPPAMPDGTPVSSLDHLLRHLPRPEAGHATSTGGQEADHVEATDRERLLDRLLASGQGAVPLVEAWANGVGDTVHESGRCFDCNGQARIRVLSVPGVRGRHRILRCWHCGALAHLPEHDRITLRWPDGARANVAISDAQGVLAARWHMSGKALPARHASQPCTPTESGAPGPTLDVFALARPIGPVSLSWLYLRGDDWGVVTVRRHFGRGEPS